MDNVSREIRSRIMTAVRSDGKSRTEIEFGQLLTAAGARGYRKQWRVHGSKPDFAWPGRKVAIFVDGCFWHGCTRCKSLPTSNVEFWRTKIEGNRRRDRRVTRALRRQGWKVIRIWECHIRRSSSIQRVTEVVNSQYSISARKNCALTSR